MSNRGNQKNQMPAPSKVQVDKEEAELLAQAEQEELEAADAEGSDEDPAEELSEEELKAKAKADAEAALKAEMDAKQALLPKHSQTIKGPVAPVPGDDSKKSVVPRKGPIRVVALRDGFIFNSRKVTGDIFTIENEKQLGKWMKII